MRAETGIYIEPRALPRRTEAVYRELGVDGAGRCGPDGTSCCYRSTRDSAVRACGKCAIDPPASG